MKQTGAWIGAVLAVSFAGATNAASVQYQVTATHTAHEVVWNGTQNVPIYSNLLFAPGTTVSASFSYDSATVATSTNNVGTNDLSGFGLSSYYTGSVSDFSGSVLGYSFSSSSGDTRVADSTGLSQYDGVFNQTGAFSIPASPGFSSLQGFSIGNFTLVGVAAYVVGPYDFLTSQSLPATLTNSTGSTSNTGVNLLFKDAAGTYRTATFWSGSITPVPLPSALWLLISGLGGLGLLRRKQAS